MTLEAIEGISNARPGLSGETPVMARSRELFSSVAAPRDRPATSATLLADRVEQYLLSLDGNTVTLTESGLRESFGVGTRLARQTSRILEQRGIVAPQRGGGGAGGLKPTTPSSKQVEQALAEAARGECESHAAKDARALLFPLLDSRTDPLAKILRGTITRLASPRDDFYFEEGSQASWLANKLLDDLAAHGGRAEPTFLGSLESIAMRHGVGREIAVQAARLLEDGGRVELRRGRGGGVIAARGTVARAARMTNAFASGHGIAVDDCHRVLVEINVRMIDLASSRARAVQIEAVRKMFARMEGARTSTEIGVAWYPFQREVAAAAHSAVLHVFARCLAGSLLLRRLHAADLPEAEATELVQTSRAIVSNLERRRSRGNGAAHRRCQRALAKYW